MSKAQPYNLLSFTGENESTASAVRTYAPLMCIHTSIIINLLLWIAHYEKFATLIFYPSGTVKNE